MFAAVNRIPSMATPGRPTPTGTSASRLASLTRRFTSRPIDAMILSGVDGSGVGTRSLVEVSVPSSRSTIAALIPLPPTSTPMATRLVGPGSAGFSSSVILVASEVVHGDAAVDDEMGAVRPARLVGGQVDGHVDDLLRLAEAARRVPGEPDPLRLLVLDQPVHQQRRLDGPGTDRVRPDARRAELHREAPGEREDSALRGRVRVLRDRAAEERHEARDVDDRTAAGRLHRRDRILAAEEDATDVDGH